MSGPIASLSRTFAFGRHMGVLKLAQRAGLSVRRTLRDRVPALAANPNERSPPAPAARPPLPLFGPRSGALEVAGDAIDLTFLGRTERFSARAIDWSSPGPGPANQLWRMNLHYMEYLEAAPDDLWHSLVGSWIALNQPSAPGAWRDAWNSYALSLRAVVWMQELARRQGRISPDIRRAAHSSLAQQLRFLARNLETDLGGNHLIKNIKALIWGSAYFGGPEAAGWRARGLRLLKSELRTQILPDGMHYERSVSYHAQVFADLLECRLALDHDPFAGALDDVLDRMAQATADLAHPDGGPVLFNDSGLNMAYSPADCLGGYEQVFRSPPAPARAAFAYEQAGYFGLRTRSAYFVADCGRIAPDDLPAHGHGDVLAFEWSVMGQRIIVDQGVFEYVAGTRRQRSRSAMSHNTLCFEGADQADFFGAFRCGRRPDVTVLTHRADGGSLVLEGTHDGFKHLPGSPGHARRFEVTATGITITDRLAGHAGRTARIGFLLHPDVVAAATADGATVSDGQSRIAVAASLPLAFEPAVWWPDMGHEQPTHRLTISVPPGVHEITTRFTLEPS